MDIIRTPKISNIKMLDKCQSLIHQSTDSTKTHNTILGTLYLTATHLIFIDKEAQQETWILHSQLASIIKHPVVSDGIPIQIKCKNFCTNTFIIPREKDAHDLYTSLYQISQPLNLSDLYCFHYTASKEPFQHSRHMGWNKFNLIDEFRRQNVPNSNWSLTNLNHDYTLCDTYSKILFVPSSATDQILIASAKFRSKGRLPVLSYYYKQNSATICRCSQPLAGLSQRCVEDEQLLNCILDSNENNQKPKLLYVVDTRPKINAYANRATGKGFENTNFYENIKFHFFGIENIHVMRGSLQKLIETCEIKVPVSNSFISGIANSGWLKHIKSVLETAFFVAKTVESGISVVVHCSDGWDRTAQTCSLASLILDSYYRTLDGFQCLIEKEWLSFGHKFTDRCGHIQIGDSKEVAPVFTQFIDAVWQITQQFPNEFEFNENYLFTIHDHVYSCQFGTFIGNCEAEREEIDIKNATYSLWAKLDSQKEQYTNPLYELSEGHKLSFLEMQLFPQQIRFWRSMYNRFDFGIHPRECLDDLLLVTYNHTKSLEGHINFLKAKIEQFKKLKDEQHKLNLVDTNLIDAKQQLLTKQNSLESQSIKSFDSINSSLKIVEECMQRLEMKHNLANSEELNDKQQTTAVDETKNGVVDVNLIELINSIQSVALDWQSTRSVNKCICGGSFDQTINRASNCWSCGLVYCCRCLEKRIKLPGLLLIDKNKDELDRLSLNYELNSRLNQQFDQTDQSMNNNNNNNSDRTLNYVKIAEQVSDYKLHPLEQQLNQLNNRQSIKSIEPIEAIKPIEFIESFESEKSIQSIVEPNKNPTINFKYHPLEILDDDFEPIECDEEIDNKIDHKKMIENRINKNDKSISIQSDDNKSDLESSSNQIEYSLNDFVPVCLSCYRYQPK